MDGDPHISKPNHTEKSTLEYLSIATDYISLPLCCLAIFADILLMVVIMKYNKLKTRSNFYICNFSVFHMLYILSTPCFYIVLDLFYNSQLNVQWFCVWIRVENMGIGLALSFATGFAVDALMERKRPTWWPKYEQRYFYVFSFLYFAHFLIYAISASICLTKGMENNFNFYLLTLYYLLLLGITLYIRFKTAPYHFTTGCALMVLLIWMPLYIWYNLIYFYQDVHNVEIILWYTAFLPEYLAYSCSVAVVWKLWKTNNLFRVAFRKFFRVPISDLEYDALNLFDNKP